MTMSSPHPAGWYDDRSRPGWQRWWDGEQWTTHVRHPLPPGQPSQPPPPNPALPPYRSTGVPGGWRRPRVLVPAAVGFLALVGIAAAVSPPPDTEVVAGSDSSAVTEPEAPPSSATTADPTTTAATEAPTTVTTLPVTTVPVTEAPTTTAVPTTTAAPTTTRPPTTKRPTTAAPATTAAVKPLVGACDPNYTGACVPIASDVDCAGGEGNGPAFVDGPVQVVGSDPYRLDADNDGIGCE